MEFTWQSFIIHVLAVGFLAIWTWKGIIFALTPDRLNWLMMRFNYKWLVKFCAVRLLSVEPEQSDHHDIFNVLQRCDEQGFDALANRTYQKIIASPNLLSYYFEDIMFKLSRKYEASAKEAILKNPDAKRHMFNFAQRESLQLEPPTFVYGAWEWLKVQSDNEAELCQIVCGNGALASEAWDILKSRNDIKDQLCQIIIRGRFNFPNEAFKQLVSEYQDISDQLLAIYIHVPERREDVIKLLKKDQKMETGSCFLLKLSDKINVLITDVAGSERLLTF